MYYLQYQIFTSKNVNAVNIRHVKAVAFYLDVQYILLQRCTT